MQEGLLLCLLLSHLCADWCPLKASSHLLPGSVSVAVLEYGVTAHVVVDF